MRGPTNRPSIGGASRPCFHIRRRSLAGDGSGVIYCALASLAPAIFGSGSRVLLQRLRWRSRRKRIAAARGFVMRRGRPTGVICAKCAVQPLKHWASSAVNGLVTRPTHASFNGYYFSSVASVLRWPAIRRGKGFLSDCGLLRIRLHACVCRAASANETGDDN